MGGENLYVHFTEAEIIKADEITSLSELTILNDNTKKLHMLGQAHKNEDILKGYIKNIK